jgi:hypothetical protein
MICSKAMAQDAWTDHWVRKTVAVNAGNPVGAISASSASTCPLAYEKNRGIGGSGQ